MPITRLIFFALLLANVAFFAWQQNAGPAPGHEPQRLQQQIEPDKVQLILPERPKPAEAPAKPAPAAEAVPDTAASAKPEAPVKGDASTPALLCKSFSGFTPEAAKAAQAEISTRAPDARIALITSKESSSYWVHIPSQQNKAGAEKKVGELKQMGVDDSFIISEDGPNKWAVSLGLFKSREMADNYLQKLNKQGVRSAKIEVRDKGAEKARLEISAPADALGALAREVKPLANATLGECKPADTVKN